MTEQEIDTAGDNPVNFPEDKWEKWQQEHNNSFVYQVQRGRLGHNRGLENGLIRINNSIYGTHQGRYYLIGADSGVGKTTVSDFMFVLKAWQSAKKLGRRIKIFYCSFEISKLAKQARWCSHFIFLIYGVELPASYILGNIPNVYLTDEHMAMVKVGFERVEEIMKDVIFLEDAVHPTAIFESIVTDHYSKIGTVERTSVSAADKLKGKKGFVKHYTPDDPDYMTLLVVDHLGLIGTEMGLDLKGAMDKLSRYFIILRNQFNTTIVAIQQFSTDLLSAKRDRAVAASGSSKAAMISPTRLDFGDTKTTYRDADVVVGLVKPASFEMSDFQGYDTNTSEFGGLGDYFLAMYLMKHRQGPSDKKYAIFINYVAGICYDLPQSLEQIQPWYDKAAQLDQLCLSFSPKPD